MKMHRSIRFSAILAIFCCGILMISCGKKSTTKSRTTGWNYNDPNYGGFYVAKATEQPIGPGLVAIEGGTFTMGATQENVYSE